MEEFFHKIYQFIFENESVFVVNIQNKLSHFCYYSIIMNKMIYEKYLRAWNNFQRVSPSNHNYYRFLNYTMLNHADLKHIYIPYKSWWGINQKPELFKTEKIFSIWLFVLNFFSHKTDWVHVPFIFQNLDIWNRQISILL